MLRKQGRGKGKAKGKAKDRGREAALPVANTTEVAAMAVDVPAAETGHPPAATVPVLSEDLYRAIVEAMAPELLLGAALRLNKLSLRLCTSESLWKAVCDRRWPGGVPPSSDYRRHFVLRIALDRRSAPPDPGSPANWGMHLLIEIPSKDGPAFRACLPLRDATLVKGRSMLRRGWGDPVDTPVESAMLKWDLHTTNIDGFLGACYLWGPGERMCQITPPAGKRSCGRPEMRDTPRMDMRTRSDASTESLRTTQASSTTSRPSATGG